MKLKYLLLFFMGAFAFQSFATSGNSCYSYFSNKSEKATNNNLKIGTAVGCAGGCLVGGLEGALLADLVNHNIMGESALGEMLLFGTLGTVAGGIIGYVLAKDYSKSEVDTADATFSDRDRSVE